MQVLIDILILSASFIAGRIIRILNRKTKMPHLWVFGTAFAFAGMTSYLFLFEDKFSLSLIALGMGLVISNLEDMSEFKIYGSSTHYKKRFWGID